MKFRIKKRWSAPQNRVDKPHAGDEPPAKQAAKPEQAPCAKQAVATKRADSAAPRTLGNPYGRLFTKYRKFSELLIKNRDDSPHKIACAPNDTVTSDRAANTALTAPEKQAK